MENFLKILRQIEEKWQQRWENDRIYEPTMYSPKPKWFITVPYPYSSGPMHIGHCRTYTLGDVAARYKRHEGFNVMWPMAYHITGTPILSISARIAQKDPKIVSLYREYLAIYENSESEIDRILETFTDPINVAMYFATKLMQDFKRMGFSLDDSREFTTADPEYQRFVEWQFLILHEKGFITQGKYPVLWCPTDENAVGEDDILGGDEEKIEVTEFIGIKFRLSDGTFIVAATLRPETIYGATNIWVHPDKLYVKIKIDGEHWVVAKDVIPALILQDHDITTLETFPGSELISQQVSIPRVNREIPIYPATFIDTNHATGVVYSVPAHAPYDYIALRDLQSDTITIQKYGINFEELKNIELISLISVKPFGNWPAVEICQELDILKQSEHENLEIATQRLYKAEFYSGIMKPITQEFQGIGVSQAKELAATTFKQENIAVSIFAVSSPVKCRCGTDISVAVLPDQFFLNYGDPLWKEEARKALERMEILPEKFRSSFEHTFNWLDKRPCVRKRGLGTEFPFTNGKGWIIESLSDSVIYMAFYTIIKQIHQQSISATQLIPSVFDFIFLQKGNINIVVEESGISKSQLEMLQAEFLYWYPNDLRHTAIAHISNHLSFAIFHHVAIFSEQFWPKSFSLNELLIREGKKMGKSKGNVIPMAYIPQKYSVDLTRLHLIAVATPDSIVDWREKEVQHSLRRLQRFWEIASEESIRNATTIDITERSELNFISLILFAEIGDNLAMARKAMERYHFRDYVQYAFFNCLRKMEDYLGFQLIQVNPESSRVLRAVVVKMLPYLEPVIPHMAEELNSRFDGSSSIVFQALDSSRFVESQGTTEPPTSIEEKLLLRQAQYISWLMDDIKNIKKLLNAPVSKLYIYLCGQWKIELYLWLQAQGEQILLDMKSIMVSLKQIPAFRNYMKDIASEIIQIQKHPALLQTDILSLSQQMEAILGYEIFFKTKFNINTIQIFDYTGANIYDPHHKARNAGPMKPALYFE